RDGPSADRPADRLPRRGPSARLPSRARPPSRAPRSPSMRSPSTSWNPPVVSLSPGSLVDDQGRDRVILQLRPAFEEGQLDEEGQPHHAPTTLFDKPEGRHHRSTGGQQVVDDQHTLAGVDRILVHGQGVTPVLELVFRLDGLGRELPELPDGDEPRP